MTQDVEVITLLWTAFFSCRQTSAGISDMWCPSPVPCHCISNEIVNCAFTRLKSMPDFMHFEKMYWELDLSQNFLTELPKSGFKGIQVQTVTLGWNAIASIHPQAFVGVQYVDEVNLCHNRVKHIPTGVFSPLSTLKVLKLCYNQLTNLEYGTFGDLPRLEELDLSGNTLKVVPSDALSQLTSLQRLILRNAKLKQIDAFAFRSLPLLFLDLAENDKPLKLPPEAFCGLEPQKVHTEPGVIDWSGIKTLLLDHNGLSTLHPCIAKNVWTLSKVDVSGNPLHCDCNLLLLRELGTRTNFFGAQCASPEEKAGQYLQHIQLEDYDCRHNRTNLSCGSLCLAKPPPSMHRGGSSAAANSWEHIILAHPVVSWVFLVFCWNLYSTR